MYQRVFTLVLFSAFWFLLSSSPAVAASFVIAQSGGTTGGFSLQPDTVPPSVSMKVLPKRPIAGGSAINVEISTTNFKTNQLTEGVFMDVRIDYPKKRLLLPTSSPALENTRLFASEFTSKQGVVLLENIVFPVRGTYEVTVKARPIDGQSFEPITETFKIRVRASFPNIIIWMLIFIVFLCLGTYMRLKKPRFGRRRHFTFALLAAAALTLSMSAQNVFAQTVALEKAVSDTAVNAPSPVDIVFSPEAPVFGTTNRINLTLKDPVTGVLYDRALVSVKLESLELSRPVFGTTFHSLNGNIVFDYGFTDSGQYRLMLDVASTEFTVNTFTPFSKEILITVADGPFIAGAIVKYIFLFALLFVIGFLFGPRALGRVRRS